MDGTWLEGHEPARIPEIAHHYSDQLDWTTISPTTDWAGGGLVTTAPDLARFVHGLWSERIVERPAVASAFAAPCARHPPPHMRLASDSVAVPSASVGRLGERESPTGTGHWRASGLPCGHANSRPTLRRVRGHSNVATWGVPAARDQGSSSQRDAPASPSAPVICARLSHISTAA
jgi:CubicO group peptidase (beta-lactamase class C family)